MRMQQVKFMGLGLVLLCLVGVLGCTAMSNSIPTLNSKINDTAVTDDTMTKLEAQGCGPDKLKMTKTVMVADQQYVQYQCTTKYGLTVTVYKINDKFFITSEAPVK
jgi:hypothetical protein